MKRSLYFLKRHLTNLFRRFSKYTDAFRSLNSRFIHQPIKRHARKEQIMRNFSRASLMAAYIALAASLAACGGSPGGGSTPVPPPPPSVQKPTVTVTDMTTTGVVAANNSVKFKLDVSGDSITKVDATVTATCDGTAVPVTVSTVPVTGGTATAVPVAGTLPNGGACTYTVTGTATNAGGTSDPATATGNFQVKYKYNRFNVVVRSDQNKVLASISGEVVANLGNKTGHSNIALCGVYDILMPAGNPLASCVTPAAGNTRRYFPINPLTSELMAEVPASAIPAGAVFHSVAYGSFGDSPYANRSVSFKAMYIDVLGVGTYYFTDVDSVNLRLTNDGFATNKVIATCAALSCFDGLFTFSNP